MADRIISKIDAKARGFHRYFTGKPCRSGHICERYIAGSCVECTRLWQNANRGKVREYNNKARRKHLADPTARNELRQYHRVYYKRYYDDPVNLNKRRKQDRAREKTPEGRRRRREQRKKLLDKLAGRPRSDNCEICDSRSEIHFDHCHTSGRFRGWICQRCNLVLGNVEDNPALLRELAEYLERNNNSCPSQIDWVEKMEIERVLHGTNSIRWKKRGQEL